MSNNPTLFVVDTALALNNGQVQICSGTGDPSTGAGYTAPVGSFYLRQASSLSTTYVKIGPNDVDWITYQALNSNLTAIGNIVSGGILVETAPGAWTTRTINGTASQITITNGDGITGNPTISITNDPTIPGSAGITIPSGTTGQRPVSPSVGQTRYNTTLGFSEYWNGTAWEQFIDTQVTTDQFAPSGFVDSTQSTFSFDISTQTFTITPTATTFTIYFGGRRFVKTTESLVLPNSTNLYFIYYDTNGVLQYNNTGFDYSTQVTVAGVAFFAASPGEVIAVTDERHNVALDHVMINYLLQSQGRVYISGLDLVGFTTTGTGNNDTDAEFSMTDGLIFAADIAVNITNSNTPALPYQQILNGPAQLPMSHVIVSGQYLTTAPTQFAVQQGTSRIQYSSFNGTTFDLVDADEGSFVATWVLASTTQLIGQIITGIVGLHQSPTLAEALAANRFTDLQTIFSPGIVIETRPLYCLIFQTSSTFTNTPHAKLVHVIDYRSAPITAALDHTALSGLGDDSHPQYVHVSNPRTITAQHTFAPPTNEAPFILGTNALDQLVTGFNADYVDGHHASDFQPVDSNLTALTTAYTIGNGLYIITGNGTSQVRTIVGTSNQISVTNGDGVSGNPTIAMVSNPMIPGTGSLTVPVGTSGQRPGSPANAMVRYNSDIKALEYFSSPNWVAVGTYPFIDSAFPNGFVDRTQSIIAFDNTTRTFSITPVSTQYTIYNGGVRVFKTTTETVTIPNVSGEYFFYFDSTSTLVANTTVPDFATSVPISAVVWNVTVQVGISLLESRYGTTMDWATRQYLNKAFNVAYQQGFDLGNFTLIGTGNSDSDAELSITNGVLLKSDITINITHNSSPSAEFEQVLTPIAQVPIFYLIGAELYASTPNNFIVKQGTSRIQFNTLGMSGYTLQDASADGNYVAMWVLATSNVAEPIVAALGQREDTTLTDSKNNNTVASLTTGGFTLDGVKLLYRLIFQTSTAYTNAPHARLVDIEDLRGVEIVTVQTGGSQISHSALLNLNADDHLQYVHIANARTITAQHTFNPASAGAPFILGANATGQLVTGFNADLLDGHHSTDFQPIDSDLTALAGISSIGLYTITGSGTSTTRSLSQPGAGLTISNSDGVAGNPTFALADDLAAVENLSTTGIPVRTATSTWTTRQLVQPSSGLTISNSDGVAGNPTFALANGLASINGLATTGIGVRFAADSWITRTISGTANQIDVSNGDGVAGNPVLNISSNPILPGTGSLTVPTGTTGQRPGSPVNGMVRYNSSNATFEFRQGSAWVTYQSTLQLYSENPSTPGSNTASGPNAVTIGEGNTSSGQDAVTIGVGNTASALGAVAVGNSANATLPGQLAHAGGKFGVVGDAQGSDYIFRGQTTTQFPIEIFLDGLSTRLTLTDDSAIAFEALAVGRRTDATGGYAAFRFEGLIVRDTGAASASIIGTVNKSVITRTNVGLDTNISADTTNGSLKITVTGLASQSFNWVVRVISVEEIG